MEAAAEAEAAAMVVEEEAVVVVVVVVVAVAIAKVAAGLAIAGVAAAAAEEAMAATGPTLATSSRTLRTRALIMTSNSFSPKSTAETMVNYPSLGLFCTAANHSPIGEYKSLSMFYKLPVCLSILSSCREQIQLDYGSTYGTACGPCPGRPLRHALAVPCKPPIECSRGPVRHLWQ